MNAPFLLRITIFRNFAIEKNQNKLPKNSTRNELLKNWSTKTNVYGTKEFLCFRSRNLCSSSGNTCLSTEDMCFSPRNIKCIIRKKLFPLIREIFEINNKLIYKQMKKLFTLTKTILVAAGLCVGMSAWGQTTTFTLTGLTESKRTDITKNGSNNISSPDVLRSGSAHV